MNKYCKSAAIIPLALSFFIAAPALADTPPVPTLDNLNNQGATIPDTDPAQTYPESAYTLTEIENADPDNLPQNAITLYDKNEDGTVTPKYYLVNLKDSVTNIGSGDTTKYFEWSQNTDTGNLELKEVSTPTEGNTTITYSYNSDSFTQKIEGQTINNPTVTNPSNTSSNSYIFNSGVGLNNPEGRKDSIDNVLYIGNKVTGTLESTTSSDKYAQVLGGAVYNAGELTSVTGLFINNGVEANSTGSYSDRAYNYAYGGALYNSGTIGDIAADFIANYAFSTESSALGGAIDNYRGTIGDITGDFIGNYVTANSSAFGGAICNRGTIENIVGDFIGNYISASAPYGGAIYNSGTIENIVGDFIGNYISGLNPYGGAINNDDGTIGNITGDFIGNYVYTIDGYSLGGAICNYGYYGTATIGNITGDFIGNYVRTDFGNAYGGAIYNSGYYAIFAEIGDIKGNFIGNYAYSSYFTANGGAIYNKYGTIGDITGDFIGNYATSNNYETYGGAIYNDGGTIGAKDDDGNLTGGIYGSFINNYAKTESDSQLALGGAVYTSNDMNFIADNQTNYFSGNYTQDYRGKINNAIFVKTSASSSPIIKLQAQNNGVIVFDDQIDGGVSKQNSETGKYEIDRTNAYNLSLTGDNTGAIYLNDKVINANISIDNTNVYVNEGTNLAESRSLAVNSGVLNIQHLNNQTVNFERFSNAGTINLSSVDVDLQKESMGRITADEYGESTGKINVQGVNLLNDATKDITNVLFADEQISSSVAYTGASPIAYSPIYKYEVSYNPDDGFFTFARASAGTGNGNGSAGAGNISDSFNPAVLASPVAQQAGAYTTQLQAFNYAFQHADTFMNIPYLERVAIINSGKYALSPTGDATDVGTYSPLMIKQHDPGFWVKPYASFENVPLKNGPKVSNINYGTLIGYDSPLKTISHGFERVLTGYIGYNGASQRYSGVDAYQNGGLIGGTATFYKGNFFNATTLSVGATAGDASTMYGSENYTMLLAGIGNKTGYNFEFWDGKMILQPNFLISYTFVNTFDYNNAAGVRIESDPLHAIQLSPGLKLIGNTKNGWQPYIGVNMVWNLLDDSRVTANDVRLPEMSIRPYVQYGVGVQKRFKDKFLAFGQAMIHNGGRNGVSLTAGLRWKVGRE